MLEFSNKWVAGELGIKVEVSSTRVSKVLFLTTRDDPACQKNAITDMNLCQARVFQPPQVNYEIHHQRNVVKGAESFTNYASIKPCLLISMSSSVGDK